MDAGPLRDLLTLGAGVGTGVMSGLFGIGGAVVSTPAIRALGLSAALAVGTTLPSIFPGAVTGYVKYRSSGMIDWRIVAMTVPAGMVASIGGAELAHQLPGAGHPLMIVTALILMWSAWRLMSGKNEPLAHEVAANPVLVAALIGVVSGGMSGLLGIGGGVLMVPAFRSYLKIPLRAAVATSLVCVGFYAIPGTITHALNHGIDWRFAVWLTLGVVPGARLGATLSLKASDARLRVAFGVFLAIVAVIYLAGEIAALV